MGLLTWLTICFLVKEIQLTSCGYSYSTYEPSNVKDVGGNSCPSLRHGRKIENFSIEPLVVSRKVFPEDYFLNGQYIMKVKLMSPNIHTCWFTFTSISRLLSLLPDEKILKNQPFNGYKFQAIAKNRCGHQIISTVFYIRINEARKKISCLSIETEVEIKRNSHSCLLVPMLDISKRIEEYLEKGTNVTQITGYGKLQNKPNYMKFTMVFMDEVTYCSKTCDKQHLQHLAHKFISEFGLINRLFADALGDGYNVYSVYANTICPPQAVKDMKQKGSHSCLVPAIEYGMQDLTVPLFQLTKIRIPRDVFKDGSLKLSLTEGRGNRKCWFRMENSMMRLFPTKKYKGRYRFYLTGTNACGKSKIISFQVSVIVEHKSVPCFLFEAVLQPKVKLTCSLELFEEFQNFLSYQLPEKTFGKSLIISYIMKADKLILSFTAQKKDSGCSFCSHSYIRNIEEKLSTANLKTQRKFFRKSLLENIYVSSSCSCGKKNEKNGTVSFNTQAGVINKLVLSDSKSITAFQLPADGNLSCIVTNNGKPELWVLPLLSVSSGHKLIKHKVALRSLQLSICGVRNSIHLKVYNTKLKESSCYSVTERVSLRKGMCILQTIKDIIASFSKKVNVSTDNILITKYEKITKSHQSLWEEILLQLSFSSECSDHCSNKLLKNRIQKAFLHHHNIKEKNRLAFIIHNVTFNECNFDADAFGILHTSRSYVPLWVYLLPAFFGLLILFVFFLACCCFRCSKKYGFCCVTNENIHRVPLSYPATNMIECKRYVTGANSWSREAVINNTSNKSAEHIPIGPIRTLSDISTVRKSNNDTTPYATIDIPKEKTVNTSTDDPVMKQSTTTTRETTYSRKHINNEPGKQNSKANKTMEHFYVKQPIYMTILDNEGNHQARHMTSTKTSKRIRSYSDGFVLDELNLPNPPCSSNRKNEENEFNDHTLLCRIGRGQNRDDMSLCARRRKVTIPFKMTARVKNVSRSCDDILSETRPRYVKFKNTSHTNDFEPVTFPRRKRFVGHENRNTFRIPSYNKDSFNVLNDYMVESWKDNRTATNEESPSRRNMFAEKSKGDKTDDRNVLSLSMESHHNIWSKPRATKRYAKIESQNPHSEF